MNILIVEDDALLQNWLSMLLTSLPAYQPTVFKAGDGLEALEQCRIHPVDLVITDIKMPRMDGLELIQRLKEESPSIRTAVLSSYDDFAFAKTALKYGALDYILKAEMTVSDISQLLDKVRSDFQIEKALQDSSAVNYLALTTHQNQFSAFLSDGDTAGFLSSLSLPERPPVLAVMELNLRDPEASSNLPVFLAAEVCRQTLQMENLTGCAFPFRGENCILLYCPANTVSEYCEQEAAKLGALLKNNLDKYLKSYSVSDIHLFCRDLETLQKQCLQLCRTMDTQRYYGDSIPCRPHLESYHLCRQQLQYALDAGQLLQAGEILRSYVQEAGRQHLEPEAVRSSVQFLLNLFLASPQGKLPQTELDEFHSLLRAVSTAPDQAALAAFVDRFLHRMQKAQQQSQSPLSPVIRTALSLIQKNYAGKLTLDSLASQLSINRSYLSQLFKKETGSTFGDYLEQVRIEKAKELLSTTGDSMVSIAEQTGFNNQNYFTKVFKAAAGVSPLHYRKLHFRCE
jgi:two-component system response regulator YesN